MHGTPDRRFPRAVYRHGVEPDPRFSLANERTFLAWIRTSLALLAAGVALEALKLPVEPTFRLAAAGAFVLLGLLAAIQAWVGWARTESSLRRDRALPGPAIGVALVVGLIVATTLLVAGTIL